MKMKRSDETASTGAVNDANKRRGRVAIITWLVAIVTVALVVTAGVAGWREYERVTVARDQVDQAIELLESAERDLVIVDTAVRTDVTSEIATSSLEANALVDGIRTGTVEAASLIASALPDLPEDEIAYAEALKESAEARADMMLYAPVILDADYKAARAIAFADAAVVEITSAEGLVAQAAVEFNKHTSDGVKQSDAYTVQAEAKLEAAESLLASATVAFPEADFSEFTAYVEAKQELAASAREIDSLWLAGKIAESNAKLTAYNERDAEIVAMAKELPQSVRDPIADAYEAVITEARAAYFSARDRAREADARAGVAGAPETGSTSSSDAANSSDASAGLESTASSGATETGP